MDNKPLDFVKGLNAVQEEISTETCRLKDSVAKTDVSQISEPEEQSNRVIQPFVDLNKLARKERISTTLRILRNLRLDLKQSPLQELKNKLQNVGLNLKVFKENPQLFDRLQCKLYHRFRRSTFRKYESLFKLINKNEFPWQVDKIWAVLHNKKRSKDTCNFLVELLMSRDALYISLRS